MPPLTVAKPVINRLLLVSFLALGLSACSLMPPAGFPRADHVNLQRFMGAWYVIANIPPSKTKNAYDALECYALSAPGTVKTVFTFRDGGFSHKLQTMHATGTVIDDSGNAVWGMEFFWPIKLQYVISYIDKNYQTTIIARSKRDYAWIMARTPKIPEAAYHKLVQRVATLGYDMSKLRKIPQQALGQRSDGCQTGIAKQ